MLEYSKDPPNKKQEFHYVYFFGYDNHNWIPVENIYKYIDHIQEFSKGPVRRDQYFTAALNYIHEQYWCLVELKREPPAESGYHIDSDDEKELEEDDRKAGRNIQQRKKERQWHKSLCGMKSDRKICQRRNIPRDTIDIDFSYLVPFVNDSSNLPIFTECPDNTLSLRYEGQDGETLAMLPNIFGSVHNFTPDAPVHLICQTVKPPCTSCNVKFGFIGLGKVNRRLIQEFLMTKHNVNIWSKISYKYDQYLNHGANGTHTPEECITSSDVIFCTIPDVDASRHIAFAKAGLYDGFANSRGTRKLYVSLTNMNEKADEEIRRAITKLGGLYFEVKIFVPLFDNRNNIPPIFLCSGDAKIYEEVKSYLNHISSEIYHYGGFSGN